MKKVLINKSKVETSNNVIFKQLELNMFLSFD